MNLLLLTIDCLRADHLSCLGYPTKTTPNLDEIAGHGTLFTQAIAVGPETPVSFKALFTSSYPFMHGGRLYVTDTTTILAQVLKDHGYHTAAFHSNPWLSSFFGYQMGFDKFDDSIIKSRSESLVGRLRKLLKAMVGDEGRLYESVRQIYASLRPGNFYSKAEAINRRAESWLQSNSNNFFLWLHYMDAHEPYLPSSRLIFPLKKYRLLELDMKAHRSPDVLAPLISHWARIYESKVAYVDAMMGALLNTLKRSNILDDTFVIITADHGQQFLEHGRYGHGHFLYDELIHVPLIIAGPGVKAQVTTEQVSLLDLAPTILDMLNIEKPKAFLGKSLLPLMNGNHPQADHLEAISEADTVQRLTEVSVGRMPRLDVNHRRISLRTGKWKYVYTEGELHELYDLQDDPGETKNVIDTKPQVATDLRGRIIAHIEFEGKSKLSEQDLIRQKTIRLKGAARI